MTYRHYESEIVYKVKLSNSKIAMSLLSTKPGVRDIA